MDPGRVQMLPADVVPCDVGVVAKYVVLCLLVGHLVDLVLVVPDMLLLGLVLLDGVDQLNSLGIQLLSDA